jgi:tetraprenyl-beta-curcumene synthase
LAVVSAADTIAVFLALVTYERQIVPFVRSELGRLQARAATIPDPVLRAAALSALREKGQNAEATAVFAILAPRANRVGALRAIVALQAAIDYLDTLGEQPVDDPLADGLTLHSALCDAVSTGGEPGDWYSLHPQREDGGYLAALVAECQERVARLPAIEAVLPMLQRAAKRCGEGQSHTHAAGAAGGDEIEAWAIRQESAPGYLWWELAAGASSSVAAHALIAAAADPQTTAEEAALIDAAYFPPIGALTVLLDDLIDRDEDAAAGAHNYTAYYRDGEEAAERLELIVGLARASLADLRQRHRHAAILAGVVGFYLSAAEAESAYAAPARERLLAASGPEVRPVVSLMRRRRG